MKYRSEQMNKTKRCAKLELCVGIKCLLRKKKCNMTYSIACAYKVFVQISCTHFFNQIRLYAMKSKHISPFQHVIVCQTIDQFNKWKGVICQIYHKQKMIRAIQCMLFSRSYHFNKCNFSTVSNIFKLAAGANAVPKRIGAKVLINVYALVTHKCLFFSDAFLVVRFYLINAWQPAHNL